MRGAHITVSEQRDRIEVEIRLSHRQKEEGTQFIYISMITNYPAFGFFMLPELSSYSDLD